jgi:hypothetical protein
VVRIFYALQAGLGEFSMEVAFIIFLAGAGRFGLFGTAGVFS